MRAEPTADDDRLAQDGVAPEAVDGEGVPTALDVLVRRVQRPAASQRPTWRQQVAQRLVDLQPASVPRAPAIVALVVAAAIGFFGWQLLARPAPIESRMPMASTEAPTGSPSSAQADSGAAGGGGTASGSSDDAGSGGAGSNGAEVTLHVAGAVNRPGLVSVPEGARVADAATAAGGLVAAADVDRVNLAATVTDGSRVFIPVVGQEIPPEVPVDSDSASQGGEPTADAPMDVNTADAETLEALPGVGPATAAAILAHREENGRFSSVESLLDVTGIGEAKLEAIRDLVTVG